MNLSHVYEEARQTSKNNNYIEVVHLAHASAAQESDRLKRICALRRKADAEVSQQRERSAAAHKAAPREKPPPMTQNIFDIYGDGLSPCMGKMFMGH